MHHLHFNSIHSTQVYLRDNLTELQTHSENVLITTNEQSLGVGRKGNKWDSYPNSLAMSFTLKPNSIPTMTPIEIGILTSQFFSHEFKKLIFLKWPNDLLTGEGEKCGGIIAQYINQSTVIVGLGLNFKTAHSINYPTHYKHGLGSIDFEKELTYKELLDVSINLYQYILENRIQSASDLQETFKDKCFHIGKEVIIDDDDKDYHGKFLGIGTNGEAIVEIEGIKKSFISSSLKILH